ncbi:MAG: flagellar protein FlaF [Rhodospirillaceae bacterium]|nr:flagellar protein FlaF [Magnetovibrio sp.]MAY68128.1 flagellar protein FlaF [Rhodospirillaceae bacterium]
MQSVRQHTAASRAYGRAHHSVISGRPAEAEAFARAAAVLREAAEQPHDRTLLARALGYNQKLWTVVQAEASDPGHPAPADMRDDMLSLARFMDRATAEALAAAEPHLDGMIAINASLSSGLFGRPA